MRFLLRVFTKANFTTLINALQHEDLGKILNIAWRKIITEKHLQKARRIYNSGKIIGQVEDCFFFDNVLVCYGWAINNKLINSIKILQGNKLLGIARIGIRRQDIGDAISSIPNAYNSGWYFESKFELESNSKILVVIENAAGHVYKQKTTISLRPYPNISSHDIQYQIFLAKNQLSQEEINEMKEQSKNFKKRPLISIIIPVYNVSGKWLDACIQSVLNQYYTHFEICIYNDASDNTSTIEVLKKYADHSKIKIKYGQNNLHIAGASNQAIQLADGKYIGLLDHDDELAPEALFEVVSLLNKHPTADFIYTDEDKIDENNYRSRPHFKSDYNPDMLRSQNYITHFAVIRKALGDQIGWFRTGYEGSQDHDLFLRISEVTDKIYHIPKVLYHWRTLPGSTATSHYMKSYAKSSAIKAIQEHYDRQDLQVSVKAGQYNGIYETDIHLSHQPEVTIIIPFRDKIDLLKNCITSIRDKTQYPCYKILLINNASRDKSTLHYLEHFTNMEGIQVLDYDVPFNYSAINNYGVSQVNSEYVLFLNSDVKIKDQGWLSKMMQHAIRPEVGAVGVKLLYPDLTIQHAGVYLGIGVGGVSHCFKHMKNNLPGYFMRPHIVQNLSSCTGACLLVRKEYFQKVQGFDEENLKISFNDIDLCLKLRSIGLLIVYHGGVSMFHYESKTRGKNNTKKKRTIFNRELSFMQQKYGSQLVDDPYYNQNLSKARADFSLRV